VHHDPSRPVKRSYENALAEKRRVERGRGRQREPVKEFVSMRSSLARAKNVEVPAIPRSSGDVGIYPPWSETWSGERFLLKLDNYWGVAIFATDENFSALRKCKEVFIDGTFRSTPVPFKQYVTIHGKYHSRVLSLVSCFMTGKTTGHYCKVFKVLKQSIRRITHHRFQPQKLICDFEQSLIIAANIELSTAHVTGCYFHYCQSLYRKIRELGLHQPYQTGMQLQKQFV
jgi:MULE transposase domain